jgi:uncharacterized membrane protein YccC
MAQFMQSPAYRSSALGRLSGFVLQEVTPYPGRAAAVARIVVACVITMVLVQLLEIPNGFLAVFYALAISRETPQAVVQNGLAIILSNIAGTAVAVIGMVLFIDYPLLHLVFVVGIFFLAFFLTRTLANYNMAFGFTIIAVAASSVNIIWANPNPLRPHLQTALGTAFGMILGTIAAVAIEWLSASPATIASTLKNPKTFPSMFVADAFLNPTHVAFALKGCLAASICYIAWSAFDWPGLGVCTVTCVLAAPLSNVDSSRWRLTTRLTALAVGAICGLVSQIVILPHVDSILGFGLPFAAVSWAAAWIATSGPRLAYFGRQMGLAYYITIFEGFGINSSLTMSRDRLGGILLGIVAMWCIFDVLWPASPSATAQDRNLES